MTLGTKDGRHHLCEMMENSKNKSGLNYRQRLKKKPVELTKKFWER